METLRRKTAEHFHGKSANIFNNIQSIIHEMKKNLLCIYLFLTSNLFLISVASKKLRKAEVLEGILETMENDGGAEN